MTNGNKPNPLDTLVNSDPKRTIALLLWKMRHDNPEFSVRIEPKDIQGFEDCVNYLDIIPEVRIFRPQGHPAQPAVEAQPPSKRNPQGLPGFPARPAEPPRNFVVVGMFVEGTQDAFKPIENNEADKDLADKKERLRRIKEPSSSLAAQVRNAASVGEFSASSVQELCEAVILLCQQP